MLFSAFLCLALAAPDERTWFPIDPGPPRSTSTQTATVLSNRVLRLTVASDGSGAVFENLMDKGAKLALDPPQLAGGGFGIKFGHPVTFFTRTISPSSGTSIASRRSGAAELTLINTAAERGYSLEWRFELRDGSNYVRESLRIDRQAGIPDDGTAARIDLVGFDSNTAKVVGTVPGSPIVAGNVFAGVEYPMSVSEVIDGHVRCSAA
jgi:hypothetical protein